MIPYSMETCKTVTWCIVCSMNGSLGLNRIGKGHAQARSSTINPLELTMRFQKMRLKQKIATIRTKKYQGRTYVPKPHSGAYKLLLKLIPA